MVSAACAPVTPGVSGRPSVATPEPGAGQQRVDVPVVAAGELHDLAAAGEPARQPDRRHRGLGAAGHQPHLLDRVDPGDDLLGERDLALGRRPVRRAAPGRGADRFDHVRVGMAEEQRPPRADQVDVATAVGVGQLGAAALDHEAGGAADGAERPDRGVDAARGDGECALEQRRATRERRTDSERRRRPEKSRVPSSQHAKRTKYQPGPGGVPRDRDHRGL